MIRVATATDPGRERDRNEDAMLAGSLDDGSWVVIVCDGMGGHEAGDVASKLAARRIWQEINAQRDDPDVGAVLAQALHAAHHQVAEDAAERGVDMGTTATVARVIDDQLTFAWVGDSRLYLFREGELVAHSVDHTVIQKLIDRGELEADADHADHPDAHVLTQAIGGDVDLLPSVGEVQLEPGDRVVLCSDGLHDLVTPEETGGLLEGAFATLATGLVDEANRRGGHDNITVAVIGFEEGEEADQVVGPPPAPVATPPAPAAATAPHADAAAPDEPGRVTPVEAPARATGPRVTVPDEPLGTRPSTTAAASAAPAPSDAGSPLRWVGVGLVLAGAVSIAVVAVGVALWLAGSAA